MKNAAERLERHLDEFSPDALRAHAELFSRPRFRDKVELRIREFLDGNVKSSRGDMSK